MDNQLDKKIIEIKSKIALFSNNLTRDLECKLIVIENFYENPYDVRKFALNQEYYQHNHHPGFRTEKQFFTDVVYSKFLDCLKPFGYTKILSSSKSSGTFQYNISTDHSWVHSDNIYDDSSVSIWAGIIYLTPNAPLSSGTGIFKHKTYGNMDDYDTKYLNNSDIITKNSKDLNEWEIVNRIGNVFNRLILFDSKQYHKSLDYFGEDIHNGRLIQIFFLKCMY